MNRYKKLIGNSAIFAVGNLGSKLMQFILIPVYSYTLTISQFGKADFITTIIGLVSPLIYLDMVDGVFRFTLDESEDKKRVFSTGLLFTTIISIIAFMTGLAVAPFISKYPILDATLLLVVTTFFGLISNYVRAIGRAGTFAVAGIINTFIMGASNIIFLVMFHGGVSSYLEAMVLGQIAAIIYFLISTPIIKQIRLKWFDIKLFREMCV
ncbi:lipopolysaccharide biosynthesis protein [Pediococcus parvulus]|uniref:lipopolysaccharide biosynthesis protein n=1 Tax=Pediococcus parvulus TaxID=54062 RepID=UPI00345E1B17